MKIAIFTGPREIGAQDGQLVRNVLGSVVSKGFRVYVGDATGVDACVCEWMLGYPWREGLSHTCNSMSVFTPLNSLGRTPAGLAERSTRMVKEAIRAGANAVLCVGFPNRPCPAGIIPARTWRSGDTEGSGTWSTLALSVGHGIETCIFPLASFPMPWGAWVSDYHIPAAWHFTPAPTLFSQSTIANGWTEYVRDENNPL